VAPLPGGAAAVAGVGSTSGTARADGVDYIFVVDVTGSMMSTVPGKGTTFWAELHPRLVENVRRLDPARGDRLHLLLFGERPKPGLAWTPVGPEGAVLPSNLTSAYFFAPKNEAEKSAMVRSVESMAAPKASTTAVRDALKSGFERALAIHAAGAARIVIAVFSDGADISSNTKPADLERFIDAASARMGGNLVNDGYIFVRVAGANIPSPTQARSRRVDETPLFASVRLGPEVLRPGPLAAQDRTAPVKVAFQLDGLNGVALPVYFEPAAGAPRVQVVCSCGKPPQWSKSGLYEVVFQRVGGPEAYMKSFEGRLKLDTRGVAQPNLVLNNLSAQGLRVVFPGAQTEPIPASAIQPATGRRVLLGSPVQFEAPVRPGAKYAWTFRGAETGTSAEPSFTRVLARAGNVDVELRVEQPGVIVPPVNLRLEVVDPALRLSASPGQPVEGEPVTLRLASAPSVQVRSIEWLPAPRAAEGPTATYQFERVGTAGLSALVTTDLGNASVELRLPVVPGLSAPDLLAPVPQRDADDVERIQLHRTSDPQALVAAVGEGTARVRFVLSQEGRTLFSGEAAAAAKDGRRVASVQVAGKDFKPGPAELTLFALPHDPAVLTRLGERKSLYRVNVNPSGVSVVKQEPTGAEIEWGRPIRFIARLEGPGVKKVSGVDWLVTVVGRDGGRTSLPGRTQPAAEWPVKGEDGAATEFEFTPDPTNPRLAALRSDAALEVEARPQGDPAVIEGAKAVWAGMSPKFAPARFVIEAPRTAALDEKMKVRVADELGGARPVAVKWELVGEPADPLRGQTGAEQEFVPEQAGLHTVKAVVEWIGGSQPAPEQSFYVDYEPLRLLSLQWDGGTGPVISGTDVPSTRTVPLKGELRGTRAVAKVDVRRVVGGSATESVAGFPREVKPAELAQGLALPFPALAGKREKGQYDVTVTFSGLDPQGRPTDGGLRRGFSIENNAPRNWLLLVIAVALLLGIGCFVHGLYSENEGRFFEARVLPDRAQQYGSDPRILQALAELRAQGGEGHVNWLRTGENSLPDIFARIFRREFPRADFPADLRDIEPSPLWKMKEFLGFRCRRRKAMIIPLARLIPSEASGWPGWIRNDMGVDLGYAVWDFKKTAFEERIYSSLALEDGRTDLELKMRPELAPPFAGIPSAPRIAELSSRTSSDWVLYFILWDASDRRVASDASKFDSAVRIGSWVILLLIGLAIFQLT
jgi:hypothetical protein